MESNAIYEPESNAIYEPESNAIYEPESNAYFRLNTKESIGQPFWILTSRIS